MKVEVCATREEKMFVVVLLGLVMWFVLSMTAPAPVIQCKAGEKCPTTREGMFERLDSLKFLDRD